MNFTGSPAERARPQRITLFLASFWGHWLVSEDGV
jgi:hypothetical protein